MDSISTCLSLLNLKSNKETKCTKDELNRSIDLYSNSNISMMERQIVKYLHGMGIQTITDPVLKEQQYWSQRRVESNKSLEEFQRLPQLSLNTCVIRLLKSRESSFSKYFHKNESILQASQTS
ncbi:unnamed protein product (macronuclear) [Paramecium tetraurelia]|uniref:Uncharacterized protein n=1 Tax=Paramecium tetraurelia TaxID=5888 RepID=A0BSZ1_PARTE|nr:uncharacterized protein GSPATT00031890001 [Paramecium tetraurelia]CAK61658.1 unnamed protein product [Paramecium tetraurelia]|eukprot:XP_001429056.1 hypothetical protein (macronuclear) [Paramecium tetraurelia strain d4-2]